MTDDREMAVEAVISATFAFIASATVVIVIIERKPLKQLHL